MCSESFLYRYLGATGTVLTSPGEIRFGKISGSDVKAGSPAPRYP
ncbi:hypothetical protein ACFSEO_07575 [Agromyces cerinus subsp. nitratus]